MVLKGLDSYGRYDLAYEIACTNLDAVVSVFKDTETVFENYSPEKVEGKFMRGSSSLPDFVGWTGIIPITIMFEYVFGIKPDASNNKITWYINRLEKHGIEKYPFGTDGELTLICEKRSSVSDKPVVTIKSNVPVTIEIIWGDNKEIIEV
jgi:hypothetical protein